LHRKCKQTISRFIYQACQKSIPVKNFANFLTTIETCYIKFYTLVTQLINCKPEKFYRITSRNDKIVLLLIISTWHFDVIKNCLTLVAFNTSINTESVNTFELFHKLYLALDEAFKKASCVAPQIWYLQWYDICNGFKFGELSVHCFFWITCRQFACRHCWVTHAVCTEPNASCWICRSIWQQSVPVFNELLNHKLLNSFNYCLQNVITKITLQWHHCRVKLVLLFVEINEN